MSHIPAREIVSKLSISKGDLLLVGSDVLQLAINLREAGERFDPNLFIDDLLDAVGSDGTLLFPTYSFEFCQNGKYDVQHTSTAMGTLSRAALARDEFRRTQHPMHSFSVAGKLQNEICGLKNVSSFGAGSPFEYLYRNDGKMLIIGLTLQGSFTFAHYAEEIEGVDFRYHKVFEGTYIDGAGNESVRKYSMYVRDLERRVISELGPLEATLLKQNVVNAQQINDVNFWSLRLCDSYPYIAADIHDNAGRGLYCIDSE